MKNLLNIKLKKLNTSDKIYVSDSKIKGAGRGVFAAKDIKKGELVERCPIIEIGEEDPSNPKEGILTNYLFYFGKNKPGQAVALGFGSIYNHTEKPNAVYKIKQKDGVIDFTALGDIKKGEEITVNYNYANPDDKTPLWFNA